ncbi:MAG TPA: LysM peptidoglycan-binding domain-containing protein [Flavobacteriales bacterium]|nr:LysM peptidoglycan-binding domain-containing protein [Flavobacteriales bacterium]HRD51050.1 LysM peptidoglycan-binding domain-containing protein [Flavobacteriales bacterium]
MPFTLRHLAFALLLPSAALAQNDPGPLALPADDPIMARLDDLANLHWIKHSPFTTDTAHHNVHGFAADHVPAWTEADMRHRLAVLDANTPFELVYNRVVQSYIDLYVVRKREMSSRMLGLAELYFPTFEQHLDRHRIPLEMKYLAVIESALNPSARSRAGAVGLWQFMLPTGKLYGLKADSYIDERHDVYKSTEAACRYLNYLYKLYGNWELAMAAYNCGPGNVNKAIRRAGGVKDYWKIYDYLPRETRGYVPAFIAVNYLFAHHADHNLYPIAPTYCAYEVDTVQVCFPLDLAAIAVLSGGTVQELRELNPMLKLGVVPDVDQPITVYLPKDAVPIFISNEDVLRYSYYAANPGTKPPVAVDRPTPATERHAERHHTVRKGESLGSIAKRYGMSVQQLRQLNGLRNDMIRPGQKLLLKRSTSATERTAQAAPHSDASGYHMVQPGDTLWSIAQRYPGVSVDDLRRMNDGLPNGLKPGSRIRVSAPKG